MLKTHATTWRIAAPSPLVMRQWTDDTAVFNPLTGHTHILDFVSACMVRSIDRRACPQAELHQLIATELALPLDEDLVAQVDRILAELGDAGLIEPAAPC